MRRFVLERNEDVSGVSGTGTVAEGVEFGDGKVALRWIASEHRSTVLWESIASVEVIHGHDGRTQVVWLDPDTRPDIPPPHASVDERARYVLRTPEVLDYIRAEKKINAIKELRDLTRMGLKEAKEAVERAQEMLDCPCVPGSPAHTCSKDGYTRVEGRPLRPWLARRDRTVHGVGEGPMGAYEIVRYDVSSKFFIEYRDGTRRQVTVAEAAELTQRAFVGRAGGSAFDRKVMTRMGVK